MICPKCGSQIDDDAAFCTNCGSAIEHDAPKEEVPVENTAPVEEEVQAEEAPATETPVEETPIEEVESTPVEDSSESFDGGFQSVPPVDEEPKKKFPIIPVIALVVVIAAVVVLFVCCGNSNKSMVKKAIKAIQNEDGEAYADLLSDKQVKELLKDNDKYDHKDDEDVADYCKDNFCKDQFKDDEFSYKILDENDATKDEIKDFNRDNDFYELKSATNYLVKITYDDEDDGYQYLYMTIAKDKDQGKVLLSDGFSSSLQSLGADYSDDYDYEDDED